jgi:enoyl-CoA hydratase
MKTHSVDLLVEESIGIVTINNPPHNCLTSPLLDECLHLFHYLTTTRIKAVVITGSARCFCSGVDLDELKNIHLRTEASALVNKGQDVVSHIEHFPVPVLAAINGVCLGGGAELALACHIRYCGETAVCGFPELSLGIMPAFGGTRLLPKIIGYGKALELILRGTILSAREARELGLVEGIFPGKGLLREVTAIAKDISCKNPHAVQFVLESVLSTRRKGPFPSPSNEELLERLLASRPHPQSHVVGI